MEREGRYICGGNIWWVNHLRTVTPSVPMNLQRVIDLQQHLYKAPAPYQGTISVILEHDGRAGDLPVKGGNLLRVSPEELTHAFILGINESLKEDAPEEVIQEWVKHSKSVCLTFRAASNSQDVYWLSFNLRESLTSKNNAVQRTARQRACEVAELRNTLQKEEGGWRRRARIWTCRMSTRVCPCTTRCARTRIYAPCCRSSRGCTGSRAASTA
jgi:hypothetical protein